MGTLTIRTTEEQDQVIEQVQKLLGESTVSKTLLRCVVEYQKLLSTLEKTQSELRGSRDRVDELENIIFHYQQSQNALMSVTRKSDTRSKQPSPLRPLAKQAIANIKESLKIS